MRFVLGVPEQDSEYNIDTQVPQVRFRIVDVPYTLPRGKGLWLNELKIGRQSLNKGTPTNRTQARGDRELVRTRGKGFCHPVPGLACEPLSNIKGADWWFGARVGNRCQDNNTLACANAFMLLNLLEVEPYTNVVLVYSVKGRRQRQRDRQYTKNKREIRRMLQGDTCPTKLDKYAPTWQQAFNCDL